MHALPRYAAASTLPLRAARRVFARVRHHTLRTSASAMSLVVRQFPALSDNYAYLIHDEETGATAAVDTPEARRAPRREEEENLRRENFAASEAKREGRTR